MLHTRRYVVLLCAFLGAACSKDGPSEPETGALSIRIDGLPTSAGASLRLVAAGQPERVINAGLLEGLAPGNYRILAAPVVLYGARYDPDPVEQDVNVLANGQPATAAVRYEVRTGGLVVVPHGVDAGVRGSFLLRGPGDFERTVAGYDTLTGLVPGRYVAFAGPITTTADSWAPAFATTETQVAISAQPSTITMPFTLTTGRISLDVTGLPAGSEAARFRLSGPNGFSREVTAGATITGLVPAEYTVTAPVTAGSALVAVPVIQRLRVTAGAFPSRASVRYTARPSLDFSIAGLTVTQSIQRIDNSIPLVAGKAAVVRVAVTANEANAAAPRVRVRVLHDGAVTGVELLEPPGQSVPTTRRDEDAMATWTLRLPATLVRPGLALAADVDPDGEFAEANDDNNSAPTVTPAVLTVAPLHVRFVPVQHMASGTTGNADGGHRFLDMSYRMFPISDVFAEVRAPMVTSAPALQPDDANGAWRQILSELYALRVAESATGTYYGVIRTPYQNGIAGIAAIGAPVALGWDWQPSASGIAAHELGHTWGRLHAPCGAPIGGSDQSFPYAGGVSGILGYDLEVRRVRLASSPDLMGYCGDPWISDYTYLGVMSFRSAGGLDASARVFAAPSVSPVQSSLLVWGRIPANGEVLLEPSFEVMARPSIPSRRGSNRLRGTSTSGETLFDFTFEGEAIADGASAERSFAFAVPLDASQRMRLAAIHVSTPQSKTRQNRRSDASAVAARSSIDRISTTNTRVRWDARQHPVVLLRGARGEVLGFLRGGDVRVPASPDVEVVLPAFIR
jgi:hypothetical protein